MNVPEGYNLYQITMTGGRPDAKMVYIAATEDKYANAYADEMATSMGYINVSVSDRRTAEERREEGDTAYHFIEPKNPISHEAPPLGEVFPELVLTVPDTHVSHLFDEKERVRRAAEDRRKTRAARRAKAKAVAG